VLADYRAAAEDELRREGEAREEAPRTFHRATHPVTRRSRCCVTPPDDLRDNGGSDDDSPSSSSSYEDDDADIRRRGPGGGARCDPDRLIKILSEKIYCKEYCICTTNKFE